MRSKVKTVIALSIIPQVLLVKLASFYPNFIENYYSLGLYQFMSKLMRYVFGWLPFSVGDLLYTLAIIYAIRWVVINRKRAIKDTLNWFQEIMVFVSLLYFAFHLFWGLNYYRLPLHESLGLEANYNTEELMEVIENLTQKSNEIHSSLSLNDTIKLTIPISKKELFKKSINGYKNLSKTYPQLSPVPKSVKKSIYSLPLTYMGFGGYFNPFTNEAQINGLNLLHKFPTTTNHEQAHQIGYAAENEANFIGSLAAMHNDDPYFQYAGFIFALKHCLIELQQRNVPEYRSVIEAINIGILKTYQEEMEFWERYKNPVEPLFTGTWNQFLKANNQDKGIESYSYVVALLVNHFKVK
jgi:hypothetical protein